MNFWCERAWLPSGVAANVRLDVHDGRFAAVAPGVPARPGDHVLRGLALPGPANAHSHAFHRVLRGQLGQRGTFWSWRSRMYEVAEQLDPDRYHQLARAVYGEMVRAGYTCVGEFHYLHHPAGGGRYRDPNAMSEALAEAAAEAGIRLTLLDTCYLSGGFDEPVEGVQQRYADADVHDWRARVEQFQASPHVLRGAALHSVRAVPAEAMPVVAEWARGKPLHVHLSEQPAENSACVRARGSTPTELLESQGVLGPSTTAVHATHLTERDTAALGASRTQICACPTTEADLADGIGPFAELARAGSPLSIGSDGQTVIDPFAEMRAVEAHQRLRTRTRGHFAPGELLAMGTRGHRALGWDDAGRLEAGARADLVTVALDGPRMAGVPAEAAPAVATAAEVRDVVVDGRQVVAEGEHLGLDVGRELRTALEEWRSP
jgi:formiminoglutamate deiminase